MGKFGGWLAGILAGIIVSCTVWYVTRPPSTTTFEGMVYSANSPVPKAMVSFELAGKGVNSGNSRELTDENGSYLMKFTGLPKSASVTMRVVATGFHDSEPVTHSIPLGPDNRQDFPLTPLAVTATPGSGPIPPRPITAHMPLYVRKASAQVFNVQLQSKP
jgi:hypothetical protein